jgi:hypothetical protein
LASIPGLHKGLKIPAQKIPSDRKQRPKRKLFVREDPPDRKYRQRRKLFVRRPPYRKYRPMRKLFVRDDNQSESIDQGERYSSEKTTRQTV